MKRLFWDIETSPNIVLSWRVGYKINIDNANILKERAIICIGYKWEHENQPRILTWDKEQSDKEMVKKFYAIAKEADELVAHNGDSFDMPWFKTRCMFHGIHSFPQVKTIDTLQWARRGLYFNSNKLDYIAQYLGIGAKIKTEFGLWKEICLNRCSKSLKRMSDYCKQDVVLLEKVWQRLSMYNAPKSHNGVIIGGMNWTCPRCGGDNVKSEGSKISALGVVQKQMRCNSCFGYYRISYKAYEMYQARKKKDNGNQ